MCEAIYYIYEDINQKISMHHVDNMKALINGYPNDTPNTMYLGKIFPRYTDNLGHF